jgi:hypothetical protein
LQSGHSLPAQHLRARGGLEVDLADVCVDNRGTLLCERRAIGQTQPVASPSLDPVHGPNPLGLEVEQQQREIERIAELELTLVGHVRLDVAARQDQARIDTETTAGRAPC